MLDKMEIDEELRLRLRRRLLSGRVSSPELANILYDVVVSINLPSFDDKDIVNAVGALLTRYEQSVLSDTCFFDLLHINMMLHKNLLCPGPCLEAAFSLTEPEAVKLVQLPAGRNHIRGLLSGFKERGSFNYDLPLRWALIAVACTQHQQHFCPGLVLWLLAGSAFYLSPCKNAAAGQEGTPLTASWEKHADAEGGHGAGQNGTACGTKPQEVDANALRSGAYLHLHVTKHVDRVSQKYQAENLGGQCDQVFLDSENEYTLLHVLAQNDFRERYHAVELGAGRKWCEFHLDPPPRNSKREPPGSHRHVRAQIMTEDCDEPRSLSSLLPISSADLLQYLFESHKGLDPDVAGKRSGRRPLHYAVLLGNSKAVRVLLDAGARVELQDSAGYGAIHYLAAVGTPQLQRAFVSSKSSKAFFDACARNTEVGNWSRDGTGAAPARRIVKPRKTTSDFREVYRLQSFREAGCARKLLHALVTRATVDVREDEGSCRNTLANMFALLALKHIVRKQAAGSDPEFLYVVTEGKTGKPGSVEVPRMSSFGTKIRYNKVAEGTRHIAALLPEGCEQSKIIAVLVSGIDFLEAQLRADDGAGEEQNGENSMRDSVLSPYSQKWMRVKNLALCHLIFSDRVARAERVAKLAEATCSKTSRLRFDGQLHDGILFAMARAIIQDVHLYGKAAALADDVIARSLPLLAKRRGQIFVKAESSTSSPAGSSISEINEQQRKADRATAVKKLRDAITSKASRRGGRGGERQEQRKEAKEESCDDLGIGGPRDVCDLFEKGLNHEDTVLLGLFEAYFIKARAFWYGSRDGEKFLQCAEEAKRYAQEAFSSSKFCHGLEEYLHAQKYSGEGKAAADLADQGLPLNQIDRLLLEPVIKDCLQSQSTISVAVRAARMMSAAGARNLLTGMLNESDHLDRHQAEPFKTAITEKALKRRHQHKHELGETHDLSSSTTTTDCRGKTVASNTPPENASLQHRVDKRRVAPPDERNANRQRVLEALKKSAAEGAGQARAASSVTSSCASDSAPQAVARTRLQKLDKIFKDARSSFEPWRAGDYWGHDLHELSVERMRLLAELYGSESGTVGGDPARPETESRSDDDEGSRGKDDEAHAITSTQTEQEARGARPLKKKKKPGSKKNGKRGGKGKNDRRRAAPQHGQVGSTADDAAHDISRKHAGMGSGGENTAAFQLQWECSKTALTKLQKQRNVAKHLTDLLTDAISVLEMQFQFERPTLAGPDKSKVDSLAQHIENAASDLELARSLWPTETQKFLCRKPTIANAAALRSSFCLLLFLPCAHPETRSLWRRLVGTEQKLLQFLQKHAQKRACRGDVKKAGHYAADAETLGDGFNLYYRVFAWRNLLAGCYEEALEVCEELRKSKSPGANIFLCEFLCLLFLEAEEESCAGRASQPSATACETDEMEVMLSDRAHEGLLHLIAFTDAQSPSPPVSGVPDESAAPTTSEPSEGQNATAFRSTSTDTPTSSPSLTTTTSTSARTTANMQCIVTSVSSSDGRSGLPLVPPERSFRPRTRTKGDVIRDLFSTEFASQTLDAFDEKVLHHTDVRLASVILNRLRLTLDVLRYVGDAPDDAASGYNSENAVVNTVLSALWFTSLFLPLKESNYFQCHPVARVAFARTENKFWSCPLRRKALRCLRGDEDVTLSPRELREMEVLTKHDEGTRGDPAKESEAPLAVDGVDSSLSDSVVEKKKKQKHEAKTKAKNRKQQKKQAMETKSKPEDSSATSAGATQSEKCQQKLGDRGEWAITAAKRTFYASDPDVFFIKDNTYAALHPSVTCRELREQFESALRKGQCSKDEKSNGIKFLGGIAELKINTDKRLWADTYHVDPASEKSLLLFDHEDNHRGIKRQTAKAAPKMTSTAADERVSSTAAKTINQTVEMIIEAMVEKTEDMPGVVRDIWGLPRNVKPGALNWRPVAELDKYLNIAHRFQLAMMFDREDL